jgi:hypothetical protein
LWGGSVELLASAYGRLGLPLNVEELAQYRISAVLAPVCGYRAFADELFEYHRVQAVER